jgi:hypothetical protein
VRVFTGNHLSFARPPGSGRPDRSCFLTPADPEAPDRFKRVEPAPRHDAFAIRFAAITNGGSPP